jgi:hypothetical protein
MSEDEEPPLAKVLRAGAAALRAPEHRNGHHLRFVPTSAHEPPEPNDEIAILGRVRQLMPR